MSIIVPNFSKTLTSPFTGGMASSCTLQLEGGRTVEIGSQPVMIGSGPRCVFRVGTKPVHCVLSLGAEGPVVRRWAEDTLLNGESFTEALLSDGDCLSIGSDHLEVQCHAGVDHLDELLEELEILEEEEAETQESAASNTVEETDESVSEDRFGVEDWLGGKSEWVTPDKPHSVEQEIDEAVIETESGNENTEAYSEPSEEESWTIESTLVQELSVEEPVTNEMSWLDFFPEELADDEFEAINTDLATTPLPVDAVDTLTIVALRARLAIRAERLRSIVETLRNERAQTEQQSAESIAIIEQLQADLENTQQQASEGIGSLSILQEELASASDRIETLEAELSNTIEAAEAVAEEEVVHSVEETQKPEELFVDTQPSVEAEPAAKEAVDVEGPLWSEPMEMEACSEEASNTVETPNAVEPNVAEALWGIENLASEPTLDGEPQKEPAEEATTGEAFVENSVELSAEELTGLLDSVLLPGEAFPESPEEPMIEPHDESSDGDSLEALAADVDDSGNSVLASLMKPLSQETSEPTNGPAEQESFIDRYADLLPEETEEERKDGPTESSLPADLVSEESPAITVGQEEGEESIDDYMKKMMDRIRGDGTPAPVAPEASQPAQAKIGSPTVLVKEEGISLEPEEEPLHNLDELKRKPTRALGADLGELRQLANQSARRAIDVAETNDRKEHATMRVVVAGVVLTSGLLACLTAPSLLSWQLYGGLAGIATGGYFGFRTLKVIQHSASLEATPINAVQDTDD